jgi:competence ComEA-like helix-hairpin-helix protein
MIDWLKDYFYYTASERRGMVVLLCVLLIGFALPKIYPYFIKDTRVIDILAAEKEANRYKKAFAKSPTASNDESDDEKDFHHFYPFPFNPNTITREDLLRLGLSPKVANTIVHFREKGGKFYKVEDFKKIWGLAQTDYNRLKDYINLETVKYKYKSDKDGSEKEEVVVENFNFDPNTATIDDLLRLGIPKRTAYTVINYREKGGRFRKKEDLKRIYSLPDSIYSRIEQYIVLDNSKPIEQTGASVAYPNTPAQPSVATTNAAATTSANTIPATTPTSYNNNFSQKKFAPAPIANIDINKASDVDWTKLPGIGQGYAKRIVNFREKLGGFCSVEQVKETFGLPDSTFQKAKPYLVASPILRKINVSTATVEELKGHPYLKWQQVNVLTNYRAQHGGKIANWEEIKKIQGLNMEIMEKIKPYLEY